MTASACCKLISNKVNDKELSEGLVSSTIIGGIAGGVLTGVDFEITNLVTTATSSEITILVVDVTTDALLNGGTRQIFDDFTRKATITKEIFIIYL